MALQFDTTFHLGDVVLSVIGTVMSIIGGRLYRAATRFFQRLDGLETRVEKSAGVIDQHSWWLRKLGARGDFPKLRRRRDDVEQETT